MPAAISCVLLVSAAFTGSGCARIAATSDIRADGSMTRTVVYNGSSPEKPKPNADGSEAGSVPESSMSPRLEDLVILPTAAGGWKVSSTRDEKSNLTVTASKVVAPGQIVRNDFGIRLPKPKVSSDTTSTPATKPKTRTAQLTPVAGLLLENSATVRQIAPGKLEYREVLHWRGSRPKEMDAPDAEMVTALKRALPASLTSDTASLKQVGISLQRELWKLMFGPGDPLLPLMVFHQDLAEYRIQKALRGAVRRSLTSVYGSRLSAEELKTAVEKMTAEVANDATKKTQAKKEAGPSGEAGGSSDNTTPVALLIRIKMPGKVTETNGELDPDTNEVVWPLYAEAAAIGDLTLTATTDVSPPK
jgi:hypothetical protein